MTPDTFVGMIEIPIKTPGFKYLDSEEEKSNFAVWFYRRETSKFSLEEFLESITPENMGWDKPSRQLYYRDKTNKLYKINFQEV